MRFVQSKLKQNRKSSRPHRMIFFDVETDETKMPGRKRLRMQICVTDYVNDDKRTSNLAIETVVHFSVEDLGRYVESKTHERTCLYLIAHNAQFDLWTSGLIKNLSEKNWEASFFYEAGMTFIFSCRKAKRKICVLSTTNWYPFSLKDCAKMINMKKIEIEFDRTDRDELIKYCKMDVKICRMLFNEYLSFIDKYDLGKFSYTSPSQAMQAFRHRFMHHDIYLHKQKDVQELEKKCYFGGRCEIWEQGKIKGGPFCSFDINSMYADAMKRNNYPRKLLYKIDNLNLQFVPQILRNFCVCGYCLIKTDIPLYAIRAREKTLFPVGEFDCYLCTEGIKEAFLRGHLLKIYKASIYECSKIFRVYVDFFYNLRLKYKSEQNDIMSYNCKTFINSLYGKWAQMIPDTREWYEKSNEVKRDWVTVEGYNRPLLMTQIMHKVVMEMTKSVGSRSFTAISAHVAEYARFHLSHIIEKIGFNKILYADTDCVKIRYKEVERIKELIDFDELGKLRFEGCTNNFTIYCPKDYVWKGKVLMKGVPKKAEKKAEAKYMGERFLKPKTLMSQGVSDYVDIVPLPKNLKREYTKAKSHKGGRFTSFCLPADKDLML